jgi:hypothetical protein
VDEAFITLAKDIKKRMIDVEPLNNPDPKENIINVKKNADKKNSKSKCCATS